MKIQLKKSRAILFSTTLLLTIFFFSAIQAQWTKLVPGSSSHFYSVHFTDANTGFAVGSLATLLKTTDGGTTWVSYNLGILGTNSLRSVHFYDNLTGYVCGGINSGTLGIIFKTTDGGNTWTDVAPVVNETFMDIFAPDELIAYAVTLSGKVYKTTNQGISWTPSAVLQFTPELKSIYMADINNGMVVGRSFSASYIYRTSDGGNTWDYLTFAANGGTGFDFGLWEVFIPVGNTAYTFNAYEIGKRTYDFGDTWSDIPSFLNGRGYGSHFIDASKGYVVGLNGNIVYTSDSTNSFCIQTSKTNATLRDVFFVNDSIGYAVGENGTIVKTTNGGFGCPVANMLPQSDSSVCIGSTLNFNGLTTGTSYHIWQEDGIIFSTSQNPSRTFNNVGTFVISYIIGKSCDGCTNDTSNITVTVNPLPVADAGVNDTICSGDSSQLNATGGVSYSWTPATGLSDNSIANPIASPVTTTIYFVTVTDTNGCTDDDNVKIVINPKPTLSVTPDTLYFCPGDNGALTANPQSGSFVYSWFNQSFDSVGTGNTLPVDTAGKYYAVNINTTTGCYNTDSSMVLFHQIYNIPDAAAICSGDSIFLQDTYQTTAGTYYDTLVTITGCDSVIVTTLSVNNSTSSSQTVTACDSYLWNGNPYTASGTYTDTILNAVGCDSIMTLNLTINNSSSSSQTVTACDSYLWNGNPYTASGTYTDTIPNAAGCDSVMMLNLTINDSTSSSQTITACNSYLWNGNPYTASGTYTDTIPNAVGCDSVMTLNLTINNSSSSSQTVTACDSYLWNGNPYTASGTYTDTIPNAGGCDSVMTLNLTIFSSINNTISANICNGQTYVFGLQTLTTSGTYTETFSTTDGCDSTVTLNLSVITSTPSITVTPSGILCDGDSVMLTASSGNSFLWNNGMNTQTIIVIATINAVTYNVTVTNANGCTATPLQPVTINANANPSVNLGNDTTICNGCSVNLSAIADFTVANFEWSTGQTGAGLDVITVSEAGTYWVVVSNSNGCSASDTIVVSMEIAINEIDEIEQNILIIPNPNNGRFKIQFDNIQIAKVKIYNAIGAIIYESTVNNKDIDLSNKPKGHYLIEIITKENTFKTKIIVQ